LLLFVDFPPVDWALVWVAALPLVDLLGLARCLWRTTTVGGPSPAGAPAGAGALGTVLVGGEAGLVEG
jgi:hypothetical protein